MLRLIAEKTFRKQHKFVYNCFIDFRKAFDNVSHDVCWAVLRSYGVEEKIINILSHIYNNSKAAVRFGKDIGDWISQEVGTKQGDPVSPTLFITYLERVLERLQDIEKRVSVHGHYINNLRFADDIDVLASNWEDLQEMVDIVSENGKKAGLIINERKTETLVFGKQGVCDNIRLNTHVIKNVDQFLYLGSLMT